MPAVSDTDKQALAARFVAEVAEYRKVTPDEIELTFHDGDVEVPGFVAMSARTPDRTVRGWVRDDGVVVIVGHTSPVPLLDALGFADDPPRIDDDRLAEIVAWGYGWTLLRRVEKGDLGMKATLLCPPLRERRDSDHALVLRCVVRVVDDPDEPAIMAIEIARMPDGAYKFAGYQLAPPYEDDDADY